MTRSSYRDCCAFCGSRALESIIDFGDVALAGAFVKPEQFAGERHYRLRACFCTECFALQLPDVVDPVELFANYFYFSSAIRSLREHFLDYASEVVARFLRPERSTVVEIGCNDGILLKPLADQGVRKPIGVDPASNIVQAIADPRITVVNDFFGSKVAVAIRSQHGPADLIVANNVYAHIPEINDVTHGVAELLSDNGVFVFEVHHLGSVMRGLQYDMIYHEHLYYYSLLALENHLRRHGMAVFDLKRIPIHGGSIRYYACKASARWAKAVTNRVHLLRQDETAQGLDRVETFRHFAAEIARRKDILMAYLERLRRAGKRVAGYGASGRANTIIQYCGIGREHLEYMIDDAPAKWGYYTPGSHFEIRSAEALRTATPDYLLVLAWGYLSEIAEKCKSYLDAGGRLIAPLPEVRLLSHVNEATTI
ncbi:MAG: methyltransferase domain-containing protein [Betaproteobacteria bacterium]